MRFVRAFAAPAVFLLFSGCGYVHFGRLPENATVMGDAAQAEAYANLSLERKMLKQELALARQDTDRLRAALERAGVGAGTPELTQRLEESTRELATLRASYAKLQAERAPPAASDDAMLRAQSSQLENKLGASLRRATELEQENLRLRTDIDHAHSENALLANQLKKAAASNDAAQMALAQLNTDLLTEKQARARAEQATESAFAQLRAVTAARIESPGATPVEGAPAPGGMTPSVLQGAKAPPAGASPTAELRTGLDRFKGPAPSPGIAAPAGRPVRTHVVQSGETLERIAQQYFGSPDRWRIIYDANTALLSNGQPLAPGMQLVIPER